MSKSARTDEIDALVSSVRDFVSHKDPRKSQSRAAAGRLVLTPEQLVAEPADVTEKSTNAEASASRTSSTVHLFEEAKRDGPANLESVLSALGGATADPAKVDAPPNIKADEPEETQQASDQSDAADSAEPQDIAEIEDEIYDAIGEIPLVGNASSQSAEADSDANLLAQVSADAMAHDALRALITEIVHEELTGELGERMTRNVRKLVRREINRVLASRELGQD